MGFWTSVGIAEPDDDGKDDAGRNLPTDAIEASVGTCIDCSAFAELGNGLCVDCWDIRVDEASANSPNWPGAWEMDFIEPAHFNLN